MVANRIEWDMAHVRCIKRYGKNVASLVLNHRQMGAKHEDSNIPPWSLTSHVASSSLKYGNPKKYQKSKNPTKINGANYHLVI